MEPDQLSVTIRAVMSLVKEKEKYLADVKEDEDISAAGDGTNQKQTNENGSQALRAKVPSVTSYAIAIAPPEMLHTDLQRLMSFVEMRSPRVVAVVLKILGAFAADNFNLRVIIDRCVPPQMALSDKMEVR